MRVSENADIREVGEVGTPAIGIDEIDELLRHNDAALPDLDVGIYRGRLTAVGKLSPQTISMGILVSFKKSAIGIDVPVIGPSGPEGTGGGTWPSGNTCVTGS